MKIKNIIASLLLTLGVGIGVTAGLAATINSTGNREIVEVEAATITHPDNVATILFEDNWNKNGLRIYYWGGKTGILFDSRPSMEYTNKTNGSGQKIYYYNIPADSTHFLITGNAGDQTLDIPLSTFRSKGNVGYFDSWNGSAEKANPGYYFSNSFTSKVIYNANNGTSTTKEETAYWGKSTTVSNCSFTYSGFSFKNWNTEPDGSGVSFNVNDNFYATNNNLTLYAQWTEVKYNVNEYRVLDGVAEETPFNTTQIGGTYLPSQEPIKGYVSKGLFLDPEGLTIFDGALSGDTDIYHIYESERIEYIYLRGLDNDKWGDPNKEGKTRTVNLYTWNSVSNKPLNGEWPGNVINLDSHVASIINFDGRGLYRIPFITNANEVPTHFIISTSGTSTYGKSADLEIVFGNYYSMNSLLVGATVGLSGDKTVGAQAALAFEIEDNIKSSNGLYQYGEKEYANSICSFDSDTINDLLTKYHNLESTDIFDNSLFWTNNIDSRKDGLGNIQENGDYSGIEIINTLTRINGGEIGGLNKLLFKDSFEYPQAIVTLIIILSVGTMALSLFLFIKRKKD